MQTYNINLPIIETIKRSFMYVIRNFKNFLKICSIFTILWILELSTNFPSLCAIETAACREDTASTVMTILIYLASVIIAISTIRSIILKQENKWFGFQFGKPHLYFIGYNFLIAAMIIIPSACMLMIGSLSKVSEFTTVTFYLIHGAFWATLIGLSIFCMRLYLVYAGAAIEDKEMNLEKSYALTSGNMLKILFGQIVLYVPTMIIAVLIYNTYHLTQWTVIGKSIFVLLILFCSFFDSALKGSYYSHLYQYFTYCEKNAINK